MQLIADVEVTTVAITFIIVFLSQFAYFVEIGYPIWRNRNPSLVGNHTYATLRVVLSTYRYSFAFFGICTASEIALLSGVGILKNNNQPLAYQCLLYCKVIQQTSCIHFFNTTVLFPSRHLWATRRGKIGEIIYYTSAVLQGTILLVAIVTSILWLTDYEARPLLCIWAIPLPAYFAYGVLATYATVQIDSATRETVQIDSATRFPIECRIHTLAVISWTAFVASAVVLGLALKDSLSIFHLIFYSTECSFCGLLLAEKCLWKCWRCRYTSEEPQRLAPISHRDHMRNPVPSVLVGRHTSRDFGYSSTTLALTERVNSSSTSTTLPLTERVNSSSTSTSLGHNDPFQLDTPRKEIKAEHTIFCQLENGKLFRAPIDEPHKVLDIGSGSGEWALNLLEKYPNTEVVMMDINPPQRHKVPSRCKIYIDDANSPWTFRPSEFDLVHIRGLAGCIQDWPALFRQVSGSLREGGYVEFCDTTLPKKSSDDEWLQCSRIAHKAGKSIGRPFVITDQNICRQYMEQAGLVFEKQIRHSKWLDPSMTSGKGISQDLLKATIQKLQGISEFGVSKLGWAEEEINRQAEDTQRELEDPAVRPYIE
ncbi:unnamed protein product, partial [Clonostachys chloroleuca]